MVDSSVYALILTATIDLLVFLAIIFTFSRYKNVRSRKLVPPPGTVWPRPTFSETEFPLSNLCEKVYNVTKEQFAVYCKPEGGLYLTFTKYIVYLLTGVSILGCCFLVPMYAFGKENPDKETDKVSFSNISENDKYAIITCFIFLAVFSLAYYYFAYQYFREAKESHVPSATETYPIHECCIEVLNIPFRLRPDEYNDEFMRKFNSVLPGGVFEAFILPDYEQLHDEYLNLLSIRERIVHYNVYQQLYEST